MEVFLTGPEDTKPEILSLVLCTEDGQVAGCSQSFILLPPSCAGLSN